MKLIHCADIHLGARQETHLDKDRAAMRRRELLQRFLDLVDYAAAHGAEAVLIAGDLFDEKRVPRRLLRAVAQKIEDNPGIRFFYLKGNHDAAAELPPLPNLETFGAAWRQVTLRTVRGRRVLLSAVELGDYSRELYEALSLREEDCNLVLLHGQAAEYGAQGAKELVDLGMLRRLPIDYLALGHYHSRTVGRASARGDYVYPGCLEGRGFDECGEHGFELVEIDDETLQLTHRFMPFALRHFYDLQADVSGCANSVQLLERIAQVLEEAGCGTRDLVRVDLTGELALDCELDLDLLKAGLEEKLFWLTLRDKTRAAVDYASYANDASLKGEFVRLVEAEEGLSEEQRAKVLRLGIRLLSGEEDA